MGTDPGVELDATSRHDVAHTKRFIERLEGDHEFRQIARQSPSSLDRHLENAGIDLAASALEPFCKLVDPACRTESTRKAIVDEVRASSLGRLWETWTKQLEEQYRIAEDNAVPTDHRVLSWRQRRIRRARSECLHSSLRTSFPLFAFELSRGCSVQCWFCAFDPPKLKDNFSYTQENRRLWREMLGVAWDLFGPGCRTAVCFHATDPTDNPDYCEFVRDVRELYGVHPQTTTARPLKNITWTRELLRSQNVLPCSFDRFSVLTVNELRKIHAAFSAEELISTSLAFQNRGALTHKARSGRTLTRRDRLEAEELVVQDEPLRPSVTQGTIECTCGYLVNMLDRTVKLVSPCFASDRWPLGYIVHGEGTFNDAAEFRDVLLRIVQESMPEHKGPGDRIAFREDMDYQPQPDGFVMTSRYRKHGAKESRLVAQLGELIRCGTLTTGEITDRMIHEGMSGLAVASWLDRLYQGGLLAD